MEWWWTGTEGTGEKPGGNFGVDDASEDGGAECRIEGIGEEEMDCVVGKIGKGRGLWKEWLGATFLMGPKWKDDFEQGNIDSLKITCLLT